MTENERLLIDAATKILPVGYEVVPITAKRRKVWAVIAREKPCGMREGFAYLYPTKPLDLRRVSGIGDTIEACLEIEYTPGDGL